MINLFHVNSLIMIDLITLSECCYIRLAFIIFIMYIWFIRIFE